MKNYIVVFLFLLGGANVQAQEFSYISGLIDEGYVYVTIDFSKESIFYPTGDENSTHAISSMAINNLIDAWELKGYMHTLSSSEKRKTRIEMTKGGITKIFIFNRFTVDGVRKMIIVLEVR